MIDRAAIRVLVDGVRAGFEVPRMADYVAALLDELEGAERERDIARYDTKLVSDDRNHKIDRARQLLLDELARVEGERDDSKRELERRGQAGSDAMGRYRGHEPLVEAVKRLAGDYHDAEARCTAATEEAKRANAEATDAFHQRDERDATLAVEVKTRMEWARKCG